MIEKEDKEEKAKQKAEHEKTVWQVAAEGQKRLA